MGDIDTGRPINRAGTGGGSWYDQQARNGFTGAQLGDVGSDIMYGSNYGILGGQNSARAQQQQFIDALRAQANGTGGPSVAQQQLMQGMDMNQKQSAGLLASQRGINPGTAARLIAQNQAGIGQQAAGQAAILRNQEQMQGQAMLGQALGQFRGQDLGQTNVLGQLSLGQSDLRLRNALGTQGLNQQNKQFYDAMNNSNDQADKARWFGLVGGGLNALGGIAGLAHGGLVPGDSPKNDTVPAMLSPGEIVLPRSVTQAEDAPERAAAFVKALHRHHYAKGGKVGGYGRVVAAKRRCG